MSLSSSLPAGVGVTASVSPPVDEINPSGASNSNFGSSYRYETPSSTFLSTSQPSSAVLQPQTGGNSGDHSRSASAPLTSPPYASSPSPSRQLPPGAAYAPDHLRRSTPSRPNSLDSNGRGMLGSMPNTRAEDVRPVQRSAVHERGASTGRAAGPGLETVTEGGSSSGAASGGPERRDEQGRMLPLQQLHLPALLPKVPPVSPFTATGGQQVSPSATSSYSRDALRASYPSPNPSFPAPSASPESYYSPDVTAPTLTTQPPESAQTPIPSPPPFQQRSSFTGIPGGRLINAKSPAPANDRHSNIPSFLPAPAFSAADHGPYPPHVSSARNSTPLSLGSPPLGGGGRGIDESELLAFGDGRPGSLAFDLPDNIAGLGRNSIIRAATGSPTPLGTQQLQQQQQQFSRSSPPAAGGVGAPPIQQLPPHLIPQPEVCVECMMRDRDMADVDVTGQGVWERESDAEFEEQMRWEGENPLLAPSNGAPGGSAGGSWSGDHGSGSQESGGLRARTTSGMAHSRESFGGRSSNNHGSSSRRRLGRGMPLSTGNLKVLTSMNPPAAAHRWRTLQTFLATQIHLLEVERQAREAAVAAAERELAAAPRTDPRSSVSSSRNRSSSLLAPGSIAAEAAALEHEERRAQAKASKTRSRSTLGDETNRYSTTSLLAPSSPIDIAPPQPPFASGAASIRSYSTGDQPWLGQQLRRFSTPGLNDNSPPKSPATSMSSGRMGMGKFARSTTDLRSSNSPRSASPAQTTYGFDDRRTSMWSRFRQSASASVLSFAPSGSMMDMHVGLAQEREAQQNMPYGHQSVHYDSYPSMSDPAVARHAEHRERDRAWAASNVNDALDASAGGGGKAKKKKGIKGFFTKLVGGKKSQRASSSAPTTPVGEQPYGTGQYDDDELAPPPPLSALVNEPRYHNRSASNSSVDSLGPYTPPLNPANFRSSYAAPVNEGGGGAPYRNVPVDRRSVLTMGSTASSRSKNGGNAAPSARTPTVVSRNSFGRPSLDSLRDPNSLPHLASPEPVLGGIDDNQGEPEILVGDADGPHPDPYPTTFPSFPPQPRYQKSLPSLPSEAMGQAREYQQQQQQLVYPMLPAPTLPYSHYGASRSDYALDRVPSKNGYAGDDFNPVDDDRRRSTLNGSSGARSKSKTRPKVFSMHFGSFGKKSKNNLNASGNGGGENQGMVMMPEQPQSSVGRGFSLDSMPVGGGGAGRRYDDASGFGLR